MLISFGKLETGLLALKHKYRIQHRYLHVDNGSNLRK